MARILIILWRNNENAFDYQVRKTKGKEVQISFITRYLLRCKENRNLPPFLFSIIVFPLVVSLCECVVSVLRCVSVFNSIYNSD